MAKTLCIYTCLFLLLGYNLSIAQNTVPMPSWVDHEDIMTISDVDAKTIEDGYFYLLINEQVNTALFHKYYHYATKIVSETGLEYASQVEIDYDPSYQNVQIHFVKIRRGNQLIDRSASAGFKILTEERERSDGILNGRKTLYANLTDIRKEDVVEYAYSIIGHNEIFGNYFSYNFSFGYSVPVGRIKRRLLINSNNRLSIKNINFDIQPVIKHGDITTYTWSVNNTLPIVLEEDTPAWFSPYPEVRISNFKNWLEVKKWLSRVFTLEKHNDVPLKQLTDSIKEKYPNNIEKQVSALVEFSQNHIRYSGNEYGIYSHKPHLPDDVLKNRYGDCKDKSLFLHALLKQLNIPSYPALLNTDLQKTITTENPSSISFNHCILAIDYQDKLYFIDPTINYQKGSFLNKSVPNYESAMLIDNQDTPFMNIPAEKNNKTDITEIFDVDKNGDATLMVETKYTGSDADDNRSYFSNISLVKIQEQFRTFYLKYADIVEVTDSLYVYDGDNNMFIVSEHYRLKNFWVKSDSTSTQITKDFKPYELNQRITYVTGALRKHPLKVRFPLHIHQKIVVNKEMTWDIPNEIFTEDNRFFKYVFDTKTSENKLVLDYTYQSKTSSVPVEEYTLYKSKVDRVSDNMVMSVVSNEDNNRAIGFNWMLLISSISSVLLAFVICYYLYSRKFPTKHIRKYNTIGGWLILVGIGIIWTPIVLLFQVYELYKDQFNVNYTYYFFNHSSSYFNPLKGYYAIVSNFGNIFLILSALLLIVLFFQQKNSFRYYYTGYKIFNIIFLFVDIIIIYLFADDPMQSQEKLQVRSETTSLIKIMFQTCIWVPYIWISARSKHTFGDMDHLNESS